MPPQRIDLEREKLPPPTDAEIAFCCGAPLSARPSMGSWVTADVDVVLELRALDSTLLSVVAECIKQRIAHEGDALVANRWSERVELAVIEPSKARSSLRYATGYTRDGLLHLLKAPPRQGWISMLVIDDYGWSVWYVRERVKN